MRFFQRTMEYICTIENVYIIYITIYHILRVAKKTINEYKKSHERKTLYLHNIQILVSRPFEQL